MSLSTVNKEPGTKRHGIVTAFRLSPTVVASVSGDDVGLETDTTDKSLDRHYDDNKFRRNNRLLSGTALPFSSFPFLSLGLPSSFHSSLRRALICTDDDDFVDVDFD